MFLMKSESFLTLQRPKNCWIVFFFLHKKKASAVRYDDIYQMDEIKSLSFHIMFYRLFRGVAKYTVYGNLS